MLQCIRAVFDLFDDVYYQRENNSEVKIKYIYIF